MAGDLMTKTICQHCADCDYPYPHEGGLLAIVDEWFHRRHRTIRPLCWLRERRAWVDLAYTET